MPKEAAVGSNMLIKPGGIETYHTWPELGVILKTIEHFDVKTFIEIGVNRGGLLAELITRCQLSQFRYYGICLEPSKIDPQLVELCDKVSNVTIIGGNCFSVPLIKHTKKIIESTYGCAMLYANGLEIPREFTAFATKALRPGDIVAAFGYPHRFTDLHVRKLIQNDVIKKLVEPWLSKDIRIYVGIVQ